MTSPLVALTAAAGMVATWSQAAPAIDATGGADTIKLIQAFGPQGIFLGVAVYVIKYLKDRATEDAAARERRAEEDAQRRADDTAHLAQQRDTIEQQTQVHREIVDEVKAISDGNKIAAASLAAASANQLAIAQVQQATLEMARGLVEDLRALRKSS